MERIGNLLSEGKCLLSLSLPFKKCTHCLDLYQARSLIRIMVFKRANFPSPLYGLLFRYVKFSFFGLKSAKILINDDFIEQLVPHIKPIQLKLQCL